MNNIKFITICDPGSSEVDALRYSLRNDLICIDYDKSIRNLSKIFNFQKFLISLDVPKDTIIVYTDAYDVLCLKRDGLEEAFLSTGKDVIYAAELINIHQTSDVRAWFKKTYKNYDLKYMNCGFCIGFYRSLVRMYNHIVESFDDIYRMPRNTSEQMVISYFMARNEIELHFINMGLDHNSVFCKTLSSTNLKNIGVISSHFVHVPWLFNPGQRDIYKRVLTDYFPELIK